MTNITARYGVPLHKTLPALPAGATITKPDAEPATVGPALDEASSAAVDLFAAAVDRADVPELARLLAVTLGAIERMKSK